MIRVRLLFLDHQILEIDVVRIVCPVRKRLRFKTGILHQYTLTILPPFLIPHARVTFSGLSMAIPLHLKGIDPDLVLNTLSADDPRTFALHFDRVTDRAQGWNLEIARWLIETGKPSDQREPACFFTRFDRKKHPWEEFVRLAADLSLRLMSIGRTGVILKQEEPLAVHARLTYSGMGLGP